MFLNIYLETIRNTEHVGMCMTCLHSKFHIISCSRHFVFERFTKELQQKSHFSNTCYFAESHDSTFSGVSIVPNSQIRTLVMLVLFTERNTSWGWP